MAEHVNRTSKESLRDLWTTRACLVRDGQGTVEEEEEEDTERDRERKRDREREREKESCRGCCSLTIKRGSSLPSYCVFQHVPPYRFCLTPTSEREPGAETEAEVQKKMQKKQKKKGRGSEKERVGGGWGHNVSVSGGTEQVQVY